MVQAMDWDPTQYQHFADERLRPFVDLVSRIDVNKPQRVVDLGCGPGNATALLADRWPEAEVTGFDPSDEMIEKATLLARPRLTFGRGDALEFHSDHDVDVLVSNATLQWVPGHLGQFGVWIDSLAAGGWFAFQVPGMREQPSHKLIYDLAGRPRYEGRLEPVIHEHAIEPSGRYLETLVGLGCEVDLWETAYFQVLQGEDAIFEWVKGSALRPFLSELKGDELEEFVNRYRTEVAELYPRGSFGTVFPFRRVFVVAHLR
jgi:trans-aconitate 2-methyltransferase